MMWREERQCGKRRDTTVRSSNARAVRVTSSVAAAVPGIGCCLQSLLTAPPPPLHCPRVGLPPWPAPHTGLGSADTAEISADRGCCIACTM